VNAAFEELRNRLAEISDLAYAGAILGWDQQTMMPARGAAVRAEQMATLGRVTHEKFTSPEIGRLLDDLRAFEEEQPHDSFEASLVRVVRQDWTKACKVPTELRAEMARAASLARPVWVEARATNDFASFLPSLKRNLELRRRYIECFDGDFDEPYDAALDDYEPGMKSVEVRSLFAYLKEHQAPIVKEVADAEPLPTPPERAFPLELQKTFELEVLRRFGYDESAWRLDPTVHPFAMSAGTRDIRLTTRYDETDLGVSLFASIHEFGHGFYESNVDPAFERTSLASVTSMSLHESQSRMWENLVGRGLPMWRFFYPKLQEAFPAQFGDVELETFYGAINKVEPSFIRVEADEVTYNMHIILRFELEQEMLSGDLALEDLPEAWNARMSEYLGIDVPDDAHGVLQDVHWSGGAIGYFPTYSLGNVVSVQLWEKLTAELPDLTSQFERGEFDDLAGWLRENLHQHGRKYTSKEMLERITGGGMDPAPYIRYLKSKMGEIYGLRVEAGAPA
jgi:carboxypeptidase Taq